MSPPASDIWKINPMLASGALACYLIVNDARSAFSKIHLAHRSCISRDIGFEAGLSIE